MVNHFLILLENGLSEVWFHYFDKATPIYEAVDHLPDNAVHIVPAVPALTGCDTTSKVGTTLQGFKVTHKPKYDILKCFGSISLDECMCIVTEQFLLQSLMKTETHKKTFDDFRYSRYHSNNFKLELDKFPCSSTTLRKHIQREYYHCPGPLSEKFRNRV